MSLQDDLNRMAPKLRRFTRALVAGHPRLCQDADVLVREALRRAAEMTGSPSRTELAIQVYALLTQTHRDAVQRAKLGESAAVEKGGLHASPHPSAEAARCARRGDVSRALAGLKLEEKEALALVVIERLSYAEAARILQISRPILIARLGRARAQLGETLETREPAPKAKARPSYLRLVK